MSCRCVKYSQSRNVCLKIRWERRPGEVSNTGNYIGTPWGIILCVDYYRDEKINGRIYHRYQTEPIRIGGMLETVFEIDAFFDRLGYPFPGTKITSAFSGLSSINMKSSAVILCSKKRGNTKVILNGRKQVVYG